MTVPRGGRHQAGPEEPGPTVRIRSLDGLRGIVIVLVVLGHGTGYLWPASTSDLPVIGGLFGGGAVVVFFVVGAFIVSRNILRDRARGTHDPLRFYLRRLVRLGGQLGLLAVALVVIWQLDPTADDGWIREPVQVANNVVHLLTYTINLYATGGGLVMPETGVMWYLSVQQQCYLLLPLVLLLARWRRTLAVVLFGVCVLVYLNRQAVLESEGWVSASVQTSTRADGLVIGVVAALLLPWIAGWKWWPTLLWVSGLTLLGLQAWLAYLPAFSFLREWSIAYTVTATVVVLSCWCTERSTLTTRLLATGPLVWLGRNSLSIYVWHVVVIQLAARNLDDWSWPARTFLAMAVLAAATVALDLLVERPTRRLLATHPLFRVRVPETGARAPVPLAPDGGAYR